MQDLLQCEVYDEETGRLYGRVTDVITTGANDVYEITDGQGKTYLFPAVPAMIGTMDVENGRMTVRPIGGIFDDAD